jgi:spermidine synthase
MRRLEYGKHMRGVRTASAIRGSILATYSIVQERERWLLGLLKRYGHVSLQEKKIAEIGCGTGYWLREFITHKSGI